MGKFHFFDFITFLLPGLIPWTGIFLLLKIYTIEPKLTVILENNSSVVTAGIVIPLAYITGHVYRWILNNYSMIGTHRYEPFKAIKGKQVVTKIAEHSETGHELSETSADNWGDFLEEALYELRHHDKADLVEILEAQYKFLHSSSIAFFSLFIANNICCWIHPNHTTCTIISAGLLIATIISVILTYYRYKLALLSCCKAWLRHKADTNQ